MSANATKKTVDITQDNVPDERFVPPYPAPHKSKISLFTRFHTGLKSWIHTLFEKSYSMKLGHVKLPATDLYIPLERSLVRQIMDQEPERFPKHISQHIMLKPLLGESIFTTNGDVWKRQRTMMNPSFAHTRLKKVFPLMKEAATELMGIIDKKDKAKPLDVDPLMTHITADVIFRTILSNPLTTQQSETVFHNFNLFQKWAQRKSLLITYNLPSGILDRLVEKPARNIRNVLRPIIAKRHDEFHKSDGAIKYDDILDSLMRAKDPNDGSHFPLEELTDNVCMLFLAGHETSAAALTWSLYLISQCPHMQDALYKEITENMVDGQIVFETIKGLKQTRNVFQEALRLYPPVSFLPREASEDMKLRSKSVKKGSMIAVSTWLLHRHREEWDQPDTFKPCRFADAREAESIKHNFMPFGRGQRLCIGMGFAYQEAVLTLAEIVSRYRLENPSGQVPEPYSRVTLRPKDNIKLYFRDRAS